MAAAKRSTISVNGGDPLEVDLDPKALLALVEDAVAADQEHVLVPAPGAGTDRVQVWIGHNAQVQVNGKDVDTFSEINKAEIARPSDEDETDDDEVDTPSSNR